MRTDIKTLYIDFDGTLVNTIESIVDLYNEDFKYYKNFNYIRWCDIDTWGFEECNCAPPGYIDLYFNQPRFFEKLKFMQWAQWAVKKLSQYYTIKIVSHGYSPNLKQKESYIKEWFPFAEFIGVNLKEYSDKAHIDMSDGCKRSGILTTTSSVSDINDDKEKKTLPRGYIVVADDNVIGLKRKVMSGCGSLHIVAMFDPITGELLETYISKGSTGGCQSNLAAVSRLISLSASNGKKN